MDLLVLLARPRLSGMVVVAAGLWLAATATAQDFAIDNEVFRGDESRPVQRTTTVFLAGKVYDLVHATGQAAVFDPAAATFVLLHPLAGQKEPDGGVQTEIPLVQLDRLVLQLKQELARREDARLRSLADPRPQFQSTPASWRLTTRWLEYQVRPLAAPGAEVAQRYYEFIRWSTRLAALESPAMLLRLELNRRLEQQHQLPQEITLLVYGAGPLGLRRPEATLRSRHRYHWQLRPRDHKQVARIQKQLAAFRRVSWREFRRLESP